jgi:hypothetical protein
MTEIKEPTEHDLFYEQDGVRILVKLPGINKIDNVRVQYFPPISGTDQDAYSVVNVSTQEYFIRFTIDKSKLDGDVSITKAMNYCVADIRLKRRAIQS